MSSYSAPTAQFYPSASLRVTDLTLYNQIKSDYNLGLGTPDPAGSNIIIGASPVALATQYGVNWVNNPVTSDYQQLPCVFTLNAESVVNAVPITPTATQNGVQTLATAYTDPNGQVFSTVTWAWAVEVMFFTVAPAGAFTEEVVTWTGDGTSNRLIPTSADLSSGVVAVWGCGGIDKSTGFNGECNFMRHNGVGMLGTALAGVGNNPVSTAIDGAGVDGITAFEAGGFRVSAGSFVFTYGNTNGCKYTAVVMRDTTPDNRYLKCGNYLGVLGQNVQAFVTHGSPAITYFGGIGWALFTSGTITDGSGTYAFTASDASNATLSPAYAGTSGVATFTISGSSGVRAITTPGTAGTPTHAWVFGGTTSVKTPEMGGSVSAALLAGASLAPPDSTHITGFGALTISVTDGCNIANRKHTYVALCADATFAAANVFVSGGGLSTTSPQVISGIAFSPALVFNRQGSPIATEGGLWRHVSQTNLAATSFRCSITGAAVNNDTTGITAIGASSITLGTGATGSVLNDPFWWWAFKGSGSADGPDLPDMATWTLTTEVVLPDGSIASIETFVTQNASPGAGWVFAGAGLTPQWWCNTTFGYSVYQIDSPGSGWVACVGPASLNGWYLSTDGFGGLTTIVSAGQPADPRPWSKLSTWTAIGNMSVFGGSPGATANCNNRMVYPASGYVVGTDYPPIRIFDGRSDKELCRLPPTTANVIPKAVMSMLAANGTVYLTTWDSGTTSADWAGRVFQLDPETGVLTVLGTVFAAGEMPYALAWHMGRLWCGTNNSIGTVGKVYYFRPGIDTTWTQDYATSTSSAGGVTSMASYGGKLYVGTDNAAGSRGKVLVRDTAGAYTTSQTGSGGTAVVNNGYLALTVLGANLYASYWNKDTPVISKIEKFTGSAWSTAYTGAGSTLLPFIVLQLDNAELYAVGGSLPYDAVILVTSNGTAWTDLTAELPTETATLLPMFGVVVT